MANEWDKEINIENLSPEERLRYEYAQREEARRMSQENLGYFVPPSLSHETIASRFRHWEHSALGEEVGYSDIPFQYTANRLIYFCHNCGCFGYKQSDPHELFKCYCCRSRNLSLYRAGELSMKMREFPTIGTNMQDVFNRRRERLRARRRAR